MSLLKAATNPLQIVLQVRGIEWSLDDSRLVSCGMDGAVYEWSTQTGKRESESVLNSCSYTGVAFSSDCKTILAVGSDLTLKEIQDCQVSNNNTLLYLLRVSINGYELKCSEIRRFCLIHITIKLLLIGSTGPEGGSC